MAKRMPSIGNGAGTSYPQPNNGGTASADSSLAVQSNGNVNNFIEDPDVLNAVRRRVQGAAVIEPLGPSETDEHREDSVLGLGGTRSVR